jgi:hypothetical protein
MFILTDEAIDAGIDNISGYIVARVASLTGKSISEVLESFFSSDVYALLSDKETGYYWDNISELIDKFIAEIHQNDTKALF